MWYNLHRISILAYSNIGPCGAQYMPSLRSGRQTEGATPLGSDRIYISPIQTKVGNIHLY